MKKVIYSLNIGNYSPEITSLTYPLIKAWADKIGAEFRLITERKYPLWPMDYEKLQIYDLGRDNDWNIYIDSDALVHPDMFDVINHLPFDHVCHNAVDMAGQRFRYDRHFRRDGRHIGSCNWFAAAHRDCIDLWRPIGDLTPEQAIANIFPVVWEQAGYLGKSKGKGHLISDYTLSRNIAQFGLKLRTVHEILNGMQANCFFHLYNISEEQKLKEIKEQLVKWHLEITPEDQSDLFAPEDYCTSLVGSQQK